ncbi:hypothetical protein [Psychromonas sp. SP041]|uniref:hypothetical protein n=1 Tax=Psychromonas sp. SP041 TaxID=1365007 RepID=UPI000428AE4C|nr:hypothetical protein [Psychromonas sp. SP041]
MKSIYFLLLSASLSLTGCGGSSDSDSNESDPSEGVFLDSAVINIGYKTETLEGVTDESGKFDYVEGESVIFFIGDLALPSVDASSTITPLDIANSTDTSDPKVINIIRLLQSIDEDGDPSNGIMISDTAKEVATPVNFDLPVDEFESSEDVTGLISHSGSTNTMLISESQAIAHFEETLVDEGVEFIASSTIVGTWRAIDDVNDLLLLIFFDDGTYVHAEIDITDLDEDSGMEWGAYSLDSETGIITTTQTFDSNGDTGLSDVETITAQVSGDQLTIIASDVVEPIEFERIESEGLLGTWISDTGDDDLLGFIYLNDGTYLHIEVIDSPAGIEWASYGLNNETREFNITNLIFDENGEAGLSDINSLFIDVTGDVMTYEITEPGETDSYSITFDRE